MQPAIVGTLIITGLAALMAIPLGILGAVYLNEYGKQDRLAAFIRFLTDVMTGVPSVVMGIFIYTVWVLHFEQRSSVRRRAGARLPDAADRRALDRGDAQARAGPPARGERRARHPHVAHHDRRRAPGRAAGHHQRLHARRRPRRRRDRAAAVHHRRHQPLRNGFALNGPNTALSTQIFSNATQPGGEPLAWGAALTLIAIVLVLTLSPGSSRRRFATR